MRIALGCDHVGYPIKEVAAKYLLSRGVRTRDFGAFSTDSVDYPDIGAEVARAISVGEFDAGILVCGAGLGMSIVANRVAGVRAALCRDVESAELSRSHNDANVLVLAGKMTPPELAVRIVEKWLDTPFSNLERHARRVAKINKMNDCRDAGITSARVTDLERVDEEIYRAVKLEEQRQRESLILIASENYASRAVLEAQGSALTNKYAEGYPGKRYYSGCEHVDVVEQIAIDRAKELFGVDHANVQPHSGAQANMAVYLALMKPGDTYMGMDLAHGGHLTHGAAVNFSGQLYHSVCYGVSRQDELLDYDEIRHLAKQHKPKLIVAGASAYPRIIDFARLREIADDVNAVLVVDMAHIAGLVAAGEHPSPWPYAQIITTTTHKTLRGPRSGLILCSKEYADVIDRAVFPGVQGGPLMHAVAAKAVCFKEAMTPEFKQYQAQVRRNAAALADTLAADGLRLVAGGTDNHLMLVDLTSVGHTGQAAQMALYGAGISVSKSMIPFDTRKPVITSGIRLGTPAVTTRGMREPEIRMIGEMICEILANIDSRDVRRSAARRVSELCAAFPAPGVGE